MTQAGAGEPDVASSEPFEDGDSDRFNRIAGAQARRVLEYVARQIVDAPEDVRVDAQEVRGQVRFLLYVAPDDRGKVIGRRGRVISSIRTLVRAAGARDGVDTNVEIPD